MDTDVATAREVNAQNVRDVLSARSVLTDVALGARAAMRNLRLLRNAREDARMPTDVVHKMIQDVVVARTAHQRDFLNGQSSLKAR